MVNRRSMSILKYVSKQPFRKLKDHNLEFPNVDLPTSGVSSRACTTMPQVDTDAETSSTSHLSSLFIFIVRLVV